MSAVRETAYAKLNLVLQVGRPRPDGLHPVCSLFASIDLADELWIEASGTEDRVECPGVAGPNLAAAAIAAYRARVPALPALHVRIEKRIPVAAGLAGGSADAAAVLRAADRIAGAGLGAAELRELAAGLGSDVPSQVEPIHAVVQGVGEIVDAVELPPLAAVLVPQAQGLATAAVFAELDRIRGWRERLDPERVGPVAADPLGGPLENDLQAATLALRPELAEVLDALTQAGARQALVSGSGPTCFGLFAERDDALGAAAGIGGAIVAQLRRRR